MRLVERFDTDEQTTLIGPGALKRLRQELEARKLSRLYVVSSTRAAKSRAGEVVREQLAGLVVGTFETVQPHAPRSDVEVMSERAGSLRADAIVAFGGGSSSDSAKALSLLLAGAEPRAGNGGWGDKPVGTLCPVVAVPTTLSGAEYTAWGALLDNGRKVGFPAVGRATAAKVVVYDPEAFSDVPDEVLQTTGMNALAHCLESAYSRETNLITQAIAHEGTIVLARGMLQLAIAGDGPGAISWLMTGAVLGGLCLATGGACIHHGLCHALGTTFGMAHGISNSVILPYALEFNAPYTRDIQENLAQALGGVLDEFSVVHGPSLPEQVAAVQAVIGVPTNLRDAGAVEGRLGEVAAEAMKSPTVQRNPRDIHAAGELLDVLGRAYRGALQ